LERDIAKTISSVDKVETDQNSLDLPPFLRR